MQTLPRLALLASLASLGCESSPPATAPVDAGTDVPPATDVASADAPAAPDVVSEDAGDPPADVPVRYDAGTWSCEAAPAAGEFVRGLAAQSWRALNRSRAVMMYGCGAATDARACLATLPLAGADDLGTGRSAVPNASLRVLFSTMMTSYYWTRSSADGRFVARGVKIRDLVRGVDIDAAGARVDPAFFPDNSGFVYQPNGRMCPQSALVTGAPTSVTVIGAGSPCSDSSLGLYEHLAVSLDGADYWASSAGTAAWDNGGVTATLTETRRNQVWGPTATVTLSLMANTGAGFRFVSQRSVATPYQGDAVISPSSRAMVTRFVDGDGAYQGYALHRLDAAHAGSAITATATELARFCGPGAKPAWSFDERWITYHHYIGGGPSADADARELGYASAADPGFAEFARRGAANVYLLDLTTGRRTRVTTMGAGQYALFPHFRADGWIYFLVRTPGTTREHVIASDAALVLE